MARVQDTECPKVALMVPNTGLEVLTLIQVATDIPQVFAFLILLAFSTVE